MCHVCMYSSMHAIIPVTEVVKLTILVENGRKLIFWLKERIFYISGLKLTYDQAICIVQCWEVELESCNVM